MSGRESVDDGGFQFPLVAGDHFCRSFDKRGCSFCPLHWELKFVDPLSGKQITKFGTSFFRRTNNRELGYPFLPNQISCSGCSSLSEGFPDLMTFGFSHSY